MDDALEAVTSSSTKLGRLGELKQAREGRGENRHVLLRGRGKPRMAHVFGDSTSVLISLMVGFLLATLPKKWSKNVQDIQ